MHMKGASVKIVISYPKIVMFKNEKLIESPQTIHAQSAVNLRPLKKECFLPRKCHKVFQLSLYAEINFEGKDSRLDDERRIFDTLAKRRLALIRVLHRVSGVFEATNSEQIARLAKTK